MPKSEAKDQTRVLSTKLLTLRYKIQVKAKANNAAVKVFKNLAFARVQKLITICYTDNT